jgi:hypothetical protein
MGPVTRHPHDLTLFNMDEQATIIMTKMTSCLLYLGPGTHKTSPLDHQTSGYPLDGPFGTTFRHFFGRPDKYGAGLACRFTGRLFAFPQSVNAKIA